MQPGCYSDDTQMSIAVAEVIVGLRHSTGIMPNARDFVDAFVRVYKRDRRSGYSKAFQVFLDSVVDTDDFIKRIQSNVSEKNGSAMRAVPIGALPHPGQVLVVASIQARTTHNTYMGRFGSRPVALMSHFALYESAGFDKLSEFLMDYLHEEINTLIPNLRTRKRGPVLQPVPNTIHAVFDLLTHSDSLFDVLRKAITMCFDTDPPHCYSSGRIY